MPNGFGFGFDFGGLLQGLLDSLLNFLEAVLQFLVDLVNALVEVFNVLFAGEQEIFGFSFKGLDTVRKIFKKVAQAIWQVAIHKALLHLFHLYQQLREWAKKLKGWLDRFHALQRRQQVQAFRRVINLIQRARRILLIFRLFHLHWADKLDHYLVKLEVRLVQRQFDLARKTNEIIGWLNLVLDPRGFLRVIPQLGSIANIIRALVGAVDAAGLGTLFPNVLGVLGPGVTVQRWREQQSTIATEVRNHAGAFAAIDAGMRESLELIERELGPATFAGSEVTTT